MLVEMGLILICFILLFVFLLIFDLREVLEVSLPSGRGDFLFMHMFSLFFIEMVVSPFLELVLALVSF